MYFYLGYMVVALIIGLIGQDRRLGFWGYFFGSLLLSPFVGLILLAASDPKRPLPAAPHVVTTVVPTAGTTVVPVVTTTSGPGSPPKV